MTPATTTRSRSGLAIAASTALAVIAALIAGVSPADATPLVDVSSSRVESSAPRAEQDVRHLVSQADAWRASSDETTSAAVMTWKERAGRSASGLRLDVEAARAFETSGGTVLRIPFDSRAGVLPQSNVSAVVEGAEVLGWSEMVLTPRSAESGRVQTWVNGAPEVDRLVGAQTPTVRSSWWSRFSSCLNSAGVAAWAITALSIACSAACVVTAGVGCIACLTAASAVTSGTISFCAGKASRG
jgi:hypothetical protein